VGGSAEKTGLAPRKGERKARRERQRTASPVHVKRRKALLAAEVDDESSRRRCKGLPGGLRKRKKQSVRAGRESEQGGRLTAFAPSTAASAYSPGTTAVVPSGTRKRVSFESTEAH
jgi:hypothetical protein